jgi:hypothetical protein
MRMMVKASPFRRGILMIAIGVLLALIVAIPKAASGQSPATNQSTAANDVNTNQDQDITVMTRNLYLGTDLDPVVEAVRNANTNPNGVVLANSVAWNNVKHTNFPERAETLADEIKQAKPMLVGLQEASLWRSGPPDSINSPPGTPPNATTVALDDNNVPLDYLAILLDKLNNDTQGPQYAAVVSNPSFDVEGVADPNLTNGINREELRDLRLTDRDVILRRTDLPKSELKLSNVQNANFATTNSFSIGGTGISVPILRGWTSVDVTVPDKKFRFINTHLEPENTKNPLDPNINKIQLAQADEILKGPAKTGLPVILAGDYNSRAAGGGTDTYGKLIGAGFADAWSTTHPGDLGNTCCQKADLLQPYNLDRRIDLVLFRNGLNASNTDIVGEEDTDRTTPSGLWPSDHAGLVAALRVGNDQGTQ